jgi:hypothetical protein
MAKDIRYRKQLSRAQRGFGGTCVKASAMRRALSWFLFLIIATAPLQPSAAMNTDSNHPGQDDQDLVTQTRETALASEGQNCVVIFCHSLSACAAHFHCTPGVSSSALPLFVQAQFFHHPMIANASLTTRFPDLLKRPPRS